jgi:hypothetical protein
MSTVTVDPKTGVLVVGGTRIFPIVLSDGPPRGGKTPTGRNAFAEIASAGVGFVRTGTGDWSLDAADRQIAAERATLDAAADHGLRGWTRLADLANLPAQTGSPREFLLAKVVNALKRHDGLGLWKGVDEPANPFRPEPVPVAGLVRGYRLLRRELDLRHPVVTIQAPLGTAAELARYRPAFDITGADIYPVSYPLGVHAGRRVTTGMAVVGDVTRKMVVAAGSKPVWTTLQIAWSGIAPSKTQPERVPRFPSLHDERFMAYQAIVAGARGLVVFGGQMTQVMKPADAELGWNWTFWQLVLRPLVEELTSAAVRPALIAPNAAARVRASVKEVELVTRRAERFLYVIAVRRGGSVSKVSFSGLPRKRDGSPIPRGQVLHEYVQDPLPPPLGGKQVFRSVAVREGGFRDWLGPQDARVYRFAL